MSQQAFVSEYAVTVGSGHGNLHAALAEGAFLIGIELNRFKPFTSIRENTNVGYSFSLQFCTLKWLYRCSNNVKAVCKVMCEVPNSVLMDP